MRPVIISITGAHSGCGKTTVAERIISGIAIAWGAVKYTRTELYAALIDDPERIEQADKDTGRMKRAGARRVYWVQSPPEGLGELLGMALDSLGGVDGIVVEGNSPARILGPDFLIFVLGDDPADMKPSAVDLIAKADAVIAPHDAAILSPAKRYNKSLPSGFNELIRDIIQRFRFS